MLRLFFDESVSHESAEHVRATFGSTAFAVHELGLRSASDEEILRRARTLRAMVVTLDLDFGLLFRFQRAPRTGVIILRLRDQTVESVNTALDRLLTSGVLDRMIVRRSLVVISDRSIRIHR